MTQEQIRSAINTIIFLLSINNIEISQVEVEKLANEYKEKFFDTHLQRFLKDKGIKTKKIKVTADNIERLLPSSIVKEKETGIYYVFVKNSNNMLALSDMNLNQMKVVSIEEFEKLFDSNIILCKKADGNDINKKFGFKWFLPSILKFKRPLVEVLVGSFIIQFFGLALPLMMQVIIDKVLVNRTVSTLHVLAIGVLITYIFDLIINISRNYVFSHTTSRIDMTLGSKLVEHLYKLPLNYFENRRVGETVARVRELDNIRRFLTGTPLMSALDVIFLIVYFIIMFMYNKKLSIILLLSLPVFAIVSLAVTPVLKTRLDEQFKAGAESQSFLVESVTGINTIKSFALEGTFHYKWEEKLADFTKTSFKRTILASNSNSVANFIERVVDLIILWVGALLVIQNNLTVGQLVAFRMISGRVSSPVLRLVQLWQEYQQAKMSVERIGDIFNLPAEDSTQGKKIRLQDLKGRIEFQDIVFRYKINGNSVLKKISFKINEGEVIGIVGRSGSGKSTISKLIQRLYIAESGRILIDNIDLNIIDQFWLRSNIGVVLQENYLFSGTIRENIALNKSSATMEEVVKVSKIAGAHDFIVSMPEGYDTYIGENGVGLSGGQRQRIAIARALINNPRILILDEATSALDYESESIIQENLKDICNNRTVIIIAHRLSTLKDADKILVIDDGQVVEFDEEENLLKQNGLYRHLYDQQKRGQL